MNAQASNSPGASGKHNDTFVEVSSAIDDLKATSVEDLKTRSDWFLGTLIAVWVASILTGMFLLSTYANTPGTQRTPLGQWPADSVLEHSGDRPTLVMFAHPHCPCTRASMAELERIVARCREKLEVIVVFIKPSQLDAGWEEGELSRMATQIPDVKVYRDEDGIETQRFQAEVSGMTVLYDRDGHLLFRGGITSARGHEGDNNGQLAVLSFIETGTAIHHKTSVFGCQLQENTAAR